MGAIINNPKKFEVLPGLPTYGPMHEQFSKTGRGTHSEGLAVRFFPVAGESWVGNFQRGWTNFDEVIGHPNGKDVIVIGGGQGYIVKPDDRIYRGYFGGPMTVGVIPVVGLSLVVFCDVTYLGAIGINGLAWTTRRISWDGIRILVVAEKVIRGECWSPIENVWIPFTLDLLTGDVQGGSYSINDIARFG
jgi:hypothetical protein